MWQLHGRHTTAFVPNYIDNTPWYSSQYASLPQVYVQDAILKIAHTQILATHRLISGDVILPFISNGHEGFDINHEEDWILCNHYIQSGEAVLPEKTSSAYLFCACSKKLIS